LTVQVMVSVTQTQESVFVRKGSMEGVAIRGSVKMTAQEMAFALIKEPAYVIMNMWKRIAPSRSVRKTAIKEDSA